MKIGSLFSGVGGIDLAFERAGAGITWNCEIDVKCRKVLQAHWPGVPRFKDVRTVTGDGIRAAGLHVDCVVGGFPCTDVSVAGKRAGLAGAQSGLFFEFARVLDEIRPAWCLVENVPGLLSSHAGADMGTVVGTLVDIGYGMAWRVLDAQYFGVAQRRRRVFIVGCLGDRARAEQVLLVGEGGGGDPPARRETGADVAGTLGGGSGSRGWAADLERMTFVPEVSHTLPAEGDPSMRRDAGTQGFLIPTGYRAEGFGQYADGVGPLTRRYDKDGKEGIVAFHMTQDPIVSDDMAPAIGGVKPTTGYSTVAVGYRKATTSHGPDNEWERWEEAEHTNTLDAGSNVTRNAHAVVEPTLAVRRLTPLECLRLQGFPDDWLDGLGLADSVKYRMVGNAVAVPVVEWIARRMMEAGEP